MNPRGHSGDRDAFHEEHKAQWQWLEGALKESRDSGRNHIFILMHWPPFFEKEDEPWKWFNWRPELRKRFLALVREYGVRATMVGHVHQTIEVETDDFTMYTVSGTSFVLDDKGYTFRLFRVYEDRVEQVSVRVAQPVETLVP